VIREADRVQRDVKGMKEESGGRKVDQFERFSCERENCILFDSLIYLEPVERLLNLSNVMQFRNFGNFLCTISRVEDKLKTIGLSRNELQ